MEHHHTLGSGCGSVAAAGLGLLGLFAGVVGVVQTMRYVLRPPALPIPEAEWQSLVLMSLGGLFWCAASISFKIQRWKPGIAFAILGAVLLVAALPDR
jgi:hypothetical protein